MKSKAALLKILDDEPLAVSVVDDEDGRLVFADIPERLVPSLREQFGEAFDTMLNPSAEEAAWVDALPEAPTKAPRYKAVDLKARAAQAKGGPDRATYFMAAINRGDEAVLGRTGVMYFVCRKGCHFCQYGEFEEHTLTVEQAAERMLAFQEAGADNVQWLSPTSYTKFLVRALARAVEQGLNIPVVHKSEGEDSAEDLRLLDGLVDIYLPDAKFIRKEAAARIGLSPQYPQRMQAALKEMIRQTGPLTRKAGTRVAQSGTLIRHLIMPGGIDEAAAVFDFLATLGKDVAVDVMTSYRPLHKAERVPEIARNCTHAEILTGVAAAKRAGLRVLVR